MPIKEKLSRIARGLCFLFCLLLSHQGWSSDPAPEECGDGFSLLPRAPLGDEIIVLPEDALENLRINTRPATHALGAPEIPPARGVTGGASSVVVAPIGVAIPRPVVPALPDIARGHEEIYRRFMSGRLIYKPDPSSDVGKIEMPFASVVNPETLEGTFDLSRCGDAGKYLSISTGYQKERKPENSSKVETWIVPKFVVERDIDTTARHLARIMGSFTSPVGLFWTWSKLDNMGWYSYLIVRNFEEVSSENLYENWVMRASRRDATYRATAAFASKAFSFDFS